MTKEKLLFVLMWFPGLFWLFPFWLIKNENVSDCNPSNRMMFLHAAYAAVQLFLLFFVVIPFLRGDRP